MKIAGIDKRPVGRPKKAPELKKKMVSVRLPQWMLDWMNEHYLSNTYLIESAIKKTYKIKPEKKHDK